MIRFLAGLIVGAAGAYFLRRYNEWPIIEWTVSGERHGTFYWPQPDSPLT